MTADDTPDPREAIFDVDEYRPARRRRITVVVAAIIAAITVVRVAEAGFLPLLPLGLLAACGIIVVLWAADVFLATLTLTTDGVRLQTLLRTRELGWPEVAAAWVPHARSVKLSLKDREVWIPSVTVAAVVFVLVLAGQSPRMPGPWGPLTAGVGAAGAMVGARYTLRFAGWQHARSEGRTTGVILYDEAGNALIWFPEQLDNDDARRLRVRLKALGVDVLTGPPERAADGA